MKLTPFIHLSPTCILSAKLLQIDPSPTPLNPFIISSDFDLSVPPEHKDTHGYKTRSLHAHTSLTDYNDLLLGTRISLFKNSLSDWWSTGSDLNNDNGGGGGDDGGVKDGRTENEGRREDGGGRPEVTMTALGWKRAKDACRGNTLTP